MTAIFTTDGRLVYENAGTVRVGDRVVFGDDRTYLIGQMWLVAGEVKLEAKSGIARLGPVSTGTVLPIIRAKEPT